MKVICAHIHRHTHDNESIIWFCSFTGLVRIKELNYYQKKDQNSNNTIARLGNLQRYHIKLQHKYITESTSMNNHIKYTLSWRSCQDCHYFVLTTWLLNHNLLSVYWTNKTKEGLQQPNTCTVCITCKQ